MAAARVKVLVVDDSAVMRRLISDMLEADPRLEVVGTAADGLEALQKADSLRPDVITLDVDMPGMDGLQTLEHIMAQNPTPVVMLSGLKDPNLVLEALARGAVDFIVKPSGSISTDLYKVQDELISKIKLATFINVRKLLKVRSDAGQTVVSDALNRSSTPVARRQWGRRQPRAVAIGASTGGPHALEEVLSALPEDLPAAVLVVQHMPAGFTSFLADRLNRCCSLAVKEGEDGEPVERGRVYIARGDHHMSVVGHPSRATLRMDRSPPVFGLRPSANVLMRSVAETFKAGSVGVILTGMGSDGADGMGVIKARGGRTIAQDQATSVIYGMPRVAVERGCVDEVLPLSSIAGAIVRALAGPPPDEWRER